MTQRCFISGANGYLGNCLSKNLIKAGYPVTSLCRSESIDKSLYFSLSEPFDAALFKECEVLIHCAYDFKALKWEEIYKTNVLGSIDLLKKAKEAGVKKIIFISSISAYEGCKSLYGRAKLEVENFARSIGAVSLRPALIYGLNSGGMIGSLEKTVRNSKIVPVVGGNQLMYLSNEDDLSDLIIKIIAEDIKILSPITAANSQPIRFIDILKKLSERASVNPIFLPLPWQAVWLGIKTAEIIGMKLNFKSDSLISLVNPNPNPDFSLLKQLGVNFRIF